MKQLVPVDAPPALRIRERKPGSPAPNLVPRAPSHSGSTTVDIVALLLEERQGEKLIVGVQSDLGGIPVGRGGPGDSPSRDRPVGFSTGALEYADFRKGLARTIAAGCPAVELSALRQAELPALLSALDSLPLASFSWVSIHAPSQFSDPDAEAAAALSLLAELPRGWHIIVHPDSLSHLSLWRQFGAQLCVENMDKRKPVGRSASELAQIFAQLPDASLCFDIGHARQYDPTMTEAWMILRDFGSRLRQVHISEVSTATSRHEPLSWLSMRAFQEIAHRVPDHIPLILETPALTSEAMGAEIRKAREALPLRMPVPSVA